jgi:K+-transporting ATPase KdpF subunit
MASADGHIVLSRPFREPHLLQDRALRRAVGVQPTLRERFMIFDYALAGLVTAGLLVYLTYALLRPERF